MSSRGNGRKYLVRQLPKILFRDFAGFLFCMIKFLIYNQFTITDAENTGFLVLVVKLAGYTIKLLQWTEYFTMFILEQKTDFHRWLAEERLHSYLISSMENTEHEKNSYGTTKAVFLQFGNHFRFFVLFTQKSFFDCFLVDDWVVIDFVKAIWFVQTDFVVVDVVVRIKNERIEWKNIRLLIA